MDVIEMMKIEKLLTISDKDIVRVQDFNDKDKKQIDKKKFHHGESQRKESRLEAKVYVILKEDFDDYEEEVKSKMTELEESIERLENQLSSIDEDHQKELKELDDEYSAKVDGLNKDLHDKDLEIKETEKEYEKKIGNLKEDNQKEINKLELFDEEKHMKIIDHQSELDNLKLFDEEKHMKITDHQSEVFGLKKENKEEIDGIKDKIVRETISHKDHISNLKKSLSFFGFLKGDYKSHLESLDEDIEHYEYIAKYIESKNDDEVQDITLNEENLS